MNRWDKLARVLKIAPRKPREAYARVAHVVESAWDGWRSQPARLDWLSPEQGERRLARALGFDRETIAEELTGLEAAIDRDLERLRDTAPFRLSHCAVASLARTAYAVCRARRPEYVVETGVAYGMTSRCVLEALEHNGSGRLDSVDLPPIADEEGAAIGALVTGSLGQRWLLHRGATRRVLPAVLERLPRVDVFIHDSLHTHRTMQHEFEAVWPLLPQGGVLVSDDVERNQAFEQLVERARPAHHWAVCEPSSRGYFGVIVK